MPLGDGTLTNRGVHQLLTYTILLLPWFVLPPSFYLGHTVGGIELPKIHTIYQKESYILSYVFVNPL
jgi:hypothetical protein